MPNKKTPRIVDILGERYADLVNTDWSPDFEDISACLEQLNLPHLQRSILKETLHFWYLNQRKPKLYPFSIHKVANRVGVAYWYCVEQMKAISSVKNQEGHIIQEHSSPLLVLTKRAGVAYSVDVGPLLALPQSMARHKKRSHKAQRPALAAMVAAQPRPDSPHMAPSMEQANQAGMVEASAAPALPEECSAVLVAFLDAQHIGQESLPGLVALVQEQRAGLDDAALLVVLERAADQATGDIKRRKIDSPYGLLTFKIKAAIGQAQQEAVEEASRAAEEAAEWAALLATLLSAKAQQVEALLREQDWPSLGAPGLLRHFFGERDWLWLLHSDPDDSILDALLAQLLPAPARIEGADQGEQPDQTAMIEANQGEQEEAAPTSEAAASLTLEVARPARIEVLRPPRFWQLAVKLNHPHAEILADDLETEVVLDGPDSWQDFRESSSPTEQRRAVSALEKIERGRLPSTGTRPPGRYRLGDRPVMEAPSAPAAQPARKKGSFLRDFLKAANNNAAML